MPQLLKASLRIGRARVRQAHEERGKHPQQKEFPSRRHAASFIQSGRGVTVEQGEVKVSPYAGSDCWSVTQWPLASAGYSA
jgi:hypothetical protein